MALASLYGSAGYRGEVFGTHAAGGFGGARQWGKGLVLRGDKWLSGEREGSGGMGKEGEG